MSFTDGKRFVVSAEDITRPWGGGKGGKYFRCYLCGHKFEPGDGCRWQYASGHNFKDPNGKLFGVVNFMTCDECDGPNVIDRWVDRNREFHSIKFWALRQDYL